MEPDTKITDVNHTMLMDDIEKLNDLYDCMCASTKIDNLNNCLKNDKGYNVDQVTIQNELIKDIWEELKKMVGGMSESLLNVEKILKERDSL